MSERTRIEIEKSGWNINYKSRILSVGSCFSTNIAAILNKYNFTIVNNPFGTLYNPISILSSPFYSEEEILESPVTRDGLWVSLLSHSDIRGETKEDLIGKLRHTTSEFRNEIKLADFLILTFGSSKVYEHIKFEYIVANCHKIPQREFKSYLLSPAQIIEAFQSFKSKINLLNPDLKIILTVSPVRYLSDGFKENSFSKAALLQSCREISEQFEDVEYFPSYEIIMDDLRDYRFFQEDLIHPNDNAIRYVWEKFENTYLDTPSLEVKTLIDRILKNLEHRPFNPESESYKKLVERTREQIEKLPVEAKKDILLKKLDSLLAT